MSLTNYKQTLLLICLDDFSNHKSQSMANKTSYPKEGRENRDMRLQLSAVPIFPGGTKVKQKSNVTSLSF